MKNSDAKNLRIHGRNPQKNAKTKPEKIVYISCNPATQVRDLQLFMEKGYHFNEITPVDMFPQTPHVESVTVLERTDK